MKRITFLFAVSLMLLVASGRKASAQLGNIDECETFYRLAKQSIWFFDYRLLPEEIQRLQADVRYDPALSSAYSALYTACVLRNGQFGGGQ